MSKVKNSVFKKAVLPIVAVLIIVAGLAYYFVHQNSVNSTKNKARPTNSINYGPSKPGDNAANDTRKSNPPSAAQTLNNGPTQSSPSNPTAPANPAGIGVTVTEAYVNGSNLTVGTQVSGTTTGTCTISVSQSGQQSITATESVSLPPHSNYYTCPVFNLPLSQFPNRGKWNVNVSVTSGSSTASGNWSQNPVNLSS
ncbi:MAG: hypothetical protein ACREGF_00595 [Candidatus Saccharimonadales bacterium]